MYPPQELRSALPHFGPPIVFFVLAARELVSNGPLPLLVSAGGYALWRIHSVENKFGRRILYMSELAKPLSKE
jgi:hypothetical protein